MENTERLTPPQQFYSLFKTNKEDKDILAQAKTEQDKLLIALFKKERVLDIIRHFVLFELDKGITIKKVTKIPTNKSHQQNYRTFASW